MRAAFVVVFGLLAACARGPGIDGSPTGGNDGQGLAYEHTVNVELAKKILAARIDALRDACTAMSAQHGCTVLDIWVEANDYLPRGSISMRLAPAGVDPMISRASEHGAVVSRRTHAEDLAPAITDTDRQLGVLTTHRDRLEGFMKSGSLPVDQLITVSKELASVQSQIDELSSRGAKLRQRIDTELLTLNLSSRLVLGSVVRFLAYTVPWLLIIVPAVLLARFGWRWISSRQE